MKKSGKFLSAFLALSMATTVFCTSGVFAAGTLKSDTTEPFSVGMGKNYTFKITASGTKDKPVVTVANGSALKVTYKGRTGNNYYYTVTATGQNGSTSGVYMALPWQKAIRCCIVTVGTPPTPSPAPVQTTQPSASKSVDLDSLNYVTEQNENSNIHFWDLNEKNENDRNCLVSNADVRYKKALVMRVGEPYLPVDKGAYTIYRDYLLNGSYKRLTGDFALAQVSRNFNIGKMTMKVYGDGKLLYTSDPVYADVLPQKVDVDVSGVKMVRIAIETDFESECICYAGFYGPQLTK